jgi:hypothetical protein
MSDEGLQNTLLIDGLSLRKYFGFKTPTQTILKCLGTGAGTSFSSNVALDA